MTKTLWCAEETRNNFEIPKYHKVTAVKIDEIESGVKNMYQDKNGNKYHVVYNKFQRRNEFVRFYCK